MSLSVIIPFKNSESTIAETLESLLESKKLINDVILIDNNSKDNSTKVINKTLMNKGLNYKLITNPRDFGISKSLNIGFRLLKNRYGMVLNSDDLISSSLIKSVILEFNENNNLALVCPSIRAFGDGMSEKVVPNNFSTMNNKIDKLINLFSENELPASGSVYRIDKISMNWLNTKNDWACDWELGFNCLLKWDVVQLQNDFVNYRVSQDSLSGKFSDHDKDIYYLFMRLRQLTRLFHESEYVRSPILYRLALSQQWSWERFPLSFLYSSRLLNIISQTKNVKLNKMIKDSLDFDVDSHFEDSLAKHNISTFSNFSKLLLYSIKSSSRLDLVMRNLLLFSTYTATIDSNGIVSKRKMM